MKTKRTIGLYAAMSSLLLCIAAFWWFGREIMVTIPRAYHSGERLSFASFRPNEFIQVKSAHGDRGVRLREYRFYRALDAKYVDVTGNVDSMEITMMPLARGRELTPKEAEGIDAIMAWFRGRGEERSNGACQYEVEYFRDNKPIGKEFFIGYYMPSQLTFLRRDTGIPQEQLRAEFDRLAIESGLIGAQLDRMFPLEQLEPQAKAR